LRNRNECTIEEQEGRCTVYCTVQCTNTGVVHACGIGASALNFSWRLESAVDGAFIAIALSGMFGHVWIGIRHVGLSLGMSGLASDMSGFHWACLGWHQTCRAFIGHVWISSCCSPIIMSLISGASRALKAPPSSHCLNCHFGKELSREAPS
jgi:hypothetical protein